jgi:hypothetical protein
MVLRLLLISLWILLPLVVSGPDAVSQESSGKKVSTGLIEGYVSDAVTNGPVRSASVRIVGSSPGAATDSSGLFVIENIPPGYYTLAITSLAYCPFYISDITVHAGQTTSVRASLKYCPLEMRGTLVQGNQFSEKDRHRNSLMEFSSQEIEHSPGSGGDISRIISIHPGVARVDDRVNSLIVRGGSSVENGFYVDNIEMPSISHFPENASSGGGYGLLNPDFIRNLSFSAGGFPAAFGNKLSSITEINFREGDNEESKASLDINVGGLTAAVEGPAKTGRTSWLFSFRRSHLEYLSKKMEFDFTPSFSDYQGKLVHNFSAGSRISLLVIVGHDNIDFNKDKSIEKGWPEYGKIRSSQFVAGINWQFLHGANDYSNTSIAVLEYRHAQNFNYVRNDAQRRFFDSHTRSIRLRHVTMFHLGRSGQLELGVDGKLSHDDYDIYTVALLDPLGGIFPGGSCDFLVRSGSLGLFTSCTVRPVSRLSATMGLRYDYYEYSDRSHMSPRLAVSFDLAENLFINGVAGIYYQSMPLGMIGQEDAVRRLKDPAAYHYVLGLNWLMNGMFTSTIEGYLKSYNFFPLDSRQPRIFLVDNLIHLGYLGFYENLVDAGRAKAYGVEITLKTNAPYNYYGLICASYSISRYLGLDNVWRDRAVDNRLVMGLEGGYRFGDKWSISLRWVYAGGAPYTPLDLQASQAHNFDILDLNRINDARYPAYYNMSLRVDRQFHFRWSRLRLYLELYNVYNRKNIFQYIWNEKDREQESINQYGLIPILGLKMEF